MLARKTAAINGTSANSADGERQQRPGRGPGAVAIDQGQADPDEVEGDGLADLRRQHDGGIGDDERREPQLRGRFTQR